MCRRGGAACITVQDKLGKLSYSPKLNLFMVLRANPDAGRAPVGRQTGTRPAPNRHPTGTQPAPDRIDTISFTGALPAPYRHPTGARPAPYRHPTGARPAPYRRPTGALPASGFARSTLFISVRYGLKRNEY